MQSIKSSYCFSLCLFTIIYFVSNTQVTAYEGVEEYSAKLVSHSVLLENSILNPTHKTSKNLQLSGNYNLSNLTDSFNSIKNIFNDKATTLVKQNIYNKTLITEYISLLHLKNPKQINNKALIKRVVKFPFFDIRNMDISDNNYIMVGNSHNLSFFSSRDSKQLNAVEDNEFTLISNSIIEYQIIKKTNNYYFI